MLVFAMAVASLLAIADPTPSAGPSPTPTPMVIILPPEPAATAATTAPVDEFGAPLSAVKIFENARLAMYLRTYPRYITYVIDVQSNAFGKHYHEGYRAMMRTYDNALTVKQTPVYTSNQAPAPYGFSFFGLFKTGKPSDHIDPPFGVPLMSATYDFGLAESPVSRANLGPREAAIAILNAPILGHVAVSGADYDVEFAGQENLDGFEAYHLTLRPLHDPDQFRLRDLWVDEQTFNVRKLVTHGIFPGGPAASATWTVTFIELHGSWYIRTESTDATLRWGRRLVYAGTEYHGVDYTFGDYAYPDLISTLEFSEPPFGTDAIQY
jgi:hypothetical protein